MIKELKFKDPTFHKGINYTVRLGSKWLDLVKAGGHVNIQGKEVLVVSTKYIRYSEIMPYVLEFEHDPTCRNFEGLNKAMHRAYPGFTDDPYYMNAYVTVVGFLIE